MKTEERNGEYFIGEQLEEEFENGVIDMEEEEEIKNDKMQRVL